MSNKKIVRFIIYIVEEKHEYSETQQKNETIWVFANKFKAFLYFLIQQIHRATVEA